MDSKDKEVTTTSLTKNIRKYWIPLAAVAGAFTGFISAALRTPPKPSAGTSGASKPPDSSNSPSPAGATTEPSVELTSRYKLTSVLCNDTSPHRFRRFLADIAVGPDDTLYSLGDDEIRIFDTGGRFLRSWKVKPKAACLDVGSDKLVYIGSLGRVDIYTPNGQHAGGIDVGDPGRPAVVTAVRIYENEILVADAKAKIIRRYDAAGKQSGVIGDKNKTGGFMLPNGWLDFDIDANGIILATDTGRHRVTKWILDGEPISAFGKFGMQDPADFVGCCNPVNLAVGPDGNIVTAEKMIARVKVFSFDGTLIGYIGPENFDPQCRNIHLEVDSIGRIIAADPVQHVIRIFSPATGSNAAE
jgi:hypothetical protein